jgi:protein TonB
VRVGGAVRPPTKILNVPPVYPDEARAAGVQGVVIIEALIGTDGVTYNTRVLRSIPLLDKAALDAVSQWRFTPTYIDGVARDVLVTMTVNFTLQ